MLPVEAVGRGRPHPVVACWEMDRWLETCVTRTSPCSDGRPVGGPDRGRSRRCWPTRCGLFLAELLASYVHVASGSVWVQTAHGWRRRYSELDPVRLATLLEVVDQTERPGVWRRLGDLALFLTGVFPDHTDARGLGPVQATRLLRSAGLAPGETGAGAGVALLELLGRRWPGPAPRPWRWLARWPTASRRPGAQPGRRPAPVRPPRAMVPRPRRLTTPARSPTPSSQRTSRADGIARWRPAR